MPYNRLGFPRLWLSVLTAVGGALTPIRADDVEEPVSFRREVVPLLTRLGCNAGACHGTPSGKNGFRLSLRGYDPAFDLASLTHDATGRRIDPLAPDGSLMLLKASARIPHEGGRRIEKDGDACAML